MLNYKTNKMKISPNFSLRGLLFIFLAGSLNLNAQELRGVVNNYVPITHKSVVGPDGVIRCHTMEADSIRRAQHPELPSLMEDELWLQNKIIEFKNEEASKVAHGHPKATLLTIPIIFHVITSGSGATNIAASRVQAQVDQLNLDYRNLSGSTNAVAADVEIEFCLAMVDPNGNVLTEPGIHRVTTYGAGTQTQTTMDNTIKPATIWDPNNYMNVWVANLGGGLLGYAQFPSSSGLAGLSANGGSASTDGVVILYTSLGSVASPTSGAAPYNLGRTLTHEMGHWLGLRHIWGDGNCTATDYCNDTPAAAAANYGCPTGTNSCTGGSYPGNDMIENYMDYTDDPCMNIFTADQKTRIRTVMDVCPRRMTLASSTACMLPASDDAGISSIVTPSSDLCTTTFTPVVTLKNFGGTTLTSCTITYNLDGGTNSVYNWTGSLSSSGTVNVTLSPMTATVGAHVFNAVTSLPNGVTDGNTGNDDATFGFNVALTTGAALPVSEGFVTSITPTGWSINNGGNALTWARVTTAGIAPTAGNAAKMDNYSTDITGDVDDLVMLPVNLSGYTNATLTFDVAHAIYNATYSDRLDVVVYGCGTAETIVYSKSGSTLATIPTATTTAFTPTASQWRNETVDLTPYIGNTNLTIAFRGISGYGNNVYIDNINLTGAGTTPPVAHFTASASSVCAGTSVTYTNTSTGNPTSYSWTFQGGTPATSTTASPSVTYPTPGVYTVSMTATNANGSNSTSQTTTVNANPTVSMAALNPVCINTPAFTLTGGSPAGGTYSGTGVTGNQFNPSTAGYGTFPITYSYTDGNGCSATSSQSISVGCAGIEENSANSFVIYPNPSEGLFTVTSTNQSIKVLNVYDGTGRLVHSISNTNGSKAMDVNMQSFAHGIYTLEITSDTSSVRERVILAK